MQKREGGGQRGREGGRERGRDGGREGRREGRISPYMLLPFVQEKNIFQKLPRRLTLLVCKE